VPTARSLFFVLGFPPMRTFICLALALLFYGQSANAILVYEADFTIDGQGATHDTVGDALESSPIAGANWVLTFGSPSSDGSTNEFITVGGVMRVQDWGGDGTVTSNPINIITDGTVDIIGRGLSIGSDAFNNVGTEGVTWFYSLNSGSPVSVFLGETELGGPVSSGTDVGNTFSSIPVSLGDILEVGFTVNVNGGGDGVEISSLSVDFAAVPEPSAFLFASLVCGVIGIRSTMKSRRERAIA